MRRAAAACCVAVLAGIVVVAQQAPTFSARVEAVRVDVHVAENGRLLGGLTRADFELFDNGVAQTIDLVNFEELPLNVVLTFDMSDSVAGPRLQHLREAGRALLAGLRSEDEAGLITFSHVVRLGSALTKELANVQAALDAARGTGLTALIDGSYAALALGGVEVGRSLVIVFSDGLDTSSWLKADAVFDSARRSDVVVYAVTEQSKTRSEFLKELTALTGGSLVEIESTKDLGATFTKILDEFRQRYLVSYSPRGVAKDGWHRLDVRVRNHRATIKARPGYLAGP